MADILCNVHMLWTEPGWQYIALMYSFSYLEPVCCSMSSSNHCFLTSIHISQEAGQVVWYSCLFQNFRQFIVIHTVKGFGIVNKAEIDAFLELFCFFHDPADVGNLISGSIPQSHVLSRLEYSFTQELALPLFLIFIPFTLSSLISISPSSLHWNHAV